MKDWNRSTLSAASLGLMPISLLSSADDFLRITPTRALVCVVKTGVEDFEVVGNVSKSKVFAGEITVSILFLGTGKWIRILDFPIRWNGHVNADASILLRK